MATLTVADASVDEAILRDVHQKTSYQHCKTKRRTACMISQETQNGRSTRYHARAEGNGHSGPSLGINYYDDCRSVYFLRSGTTCAVKVGYSKDVCRRLRALQTGNEHLLGLEY